MIENDPSGNWFAIACLVGGLICVVFGFMLIRAAVEWALMR